MLVNWLTSVERSGGLIMQPEPVIKIQDPQVLKDRQVLTVEMNRRSLPGRRGGQRHVSRAPRWFRRPIRRGIETAESCR